ncbi:unnamed protein product [marine sediment metagenome]|uniref:ABC transporter domain-containing protein n=1 Tax=marine sediment metagenome TaxID=412755 RepID=X1DBP7_9ZZZZ
MAFFEVQDLSFRYNDNWVLDTLSFTGKKGELIAIVGPSGCGKTTLLKLFVGVLKPQKGTLFLDKVNILKKPIELRNIGYVPQTQSLFPHQSVFENIAFGLKAQKWGRPEVENRVNELAETGGLSTRSKPKATNVCAITITRAIFSYINEERYKLNNEKANEIEEIASGSITITPLND